MMRIILVFLLFVITPLLSFSQRSIVKYYPNGNKESQITYIDSLNRYKETRWYEEGQLSSISYFKIESYVNDSLLFDSKKRVLDGPSISYYKNGAKSREFFFINDKSNGVHA